MMQNLTRAQAQRDSLGIDVDEVDESIGMTPLQIGAAFGRLAAVSCSLPATNKQTANLLFL